MIKSCSSTQNPPPPGTTYPPTDRHTPYTSYSQAVEAWKTPKNLAAANVSSWIGKYFKYDLRRAMTIKPGVPIYTPTELFDLAVTGNKSGVCVDLARFGVETMKEIAPEMNPRYLMIEFEPCQLGNSEVRRHWMTSFKKNGMYYFMADSANAGAIYGPYSSIDQFKVEYSEYRGRQVSNMEERDTYRGQREAPADDDLDSFNSVTGESS